MYKETMVKFHAFLFLYSLIKCWLISAIIYKMLARIANKLDPDQTASSEAVWSGSTLFVRAFLAGN